MTAAPALPRPSEPAAVRAPGTWWLWLDATPRRGFLNMAIDEAMLDLVAGGAPPVLRLYGWHPDCLSFGHHEPAAARYQADRLARRGVDVVRRPTGGRVVFHRQELTYSLAAPVAHFGSMRAALTSVHAQLQDALAALGVVTEIAPAPAVPPRPDAGPCFHLPAGGELVGAAGKVVGSAQARRRDVLLQQGSVRVPFATAAEPVARALQAIAAAWCPVAEPVPILARAALHVDRYRDPAWTWSR